MEEESNKRQHEEMDADEELPLLPGQKKRKNKSQAEAKDSEFLAELDKQLAEASQMLSEHFTERQIERYESFRRSFLKDATMRKVIQGATDKTLGKPALVAIKGAAKLFVGDLVEEARSVMDERGEVGPIRPWHVREAYVRLQDQGKVPIVEQGVVPRGFSSRRNVL